MGYELRVGTSVWNISGVEGTIIDTRMEGRAITVALANGSTAEWLAVHTYNYNPVKALRLSLDQFRRNPSVTAMDALSRAITESLTLHFDMSKSEEIKNTVYLHLYMNPHTELIIDSLKALDEWREKERSGRQRIYGSIAQLTKRIIIPFDKDKE